MLRRIALVAALLALLVQGCGCNATTSGADAGPYIPPPSENAKLIAGVVGGGLSAVEPLTRSGAQTSVAQGQIVRCYLYSAAGALASNGAYYARQVATTGEWLSAFPEIRIDTAVCRPEGTTPRVTEETEATVHKLVDQTLGPVVEVTRGVMGFFDLPCQWQAFAEWLETEAAGIAKTVVSAMAHPDEPWILPALPMPTCPPLEAPQ